MSLLSWLLIFAGNALLTVSIVYVAKKWGKTSVQRDVAEETTQEVIRIQEAGKDAKEAADSVRNDELDKRLRELGLLVDEGDEIVLPRVGREDR